MTIGILNEMRAKAGAQQGDDDLTAASDDGTSKYGEPLLGVLNDRLAYDEAYTTDASPHQYRIWLAQVGIPTIYILYRTDCSFYSVNTTTLASGQ